MLELLRKKRLLDDERVTELERCELDDETGFEELDEIGSEELDGAGIEELDKTESEELDAESKSELEMGLADELSSSASMRDVLV